MKRFIQGEHRGKSPLLPETNVDSHRDQCSSMAKQAREAMIWHYSYVEKRPETVSLLEFEMPGLRVEVAMHTKHRTTNSELVA